MATVTTPALVKALREKTGLGMMECKKALDQNDGDIEKAALELRKKGLIKAEGKSSRAANEGVIGSYIHMQGKIGVLIEINCETDFVAKNDNFRDFVKDITLHIAAASPICVAPADVSPERLEREKEVAAAQVVGKPDNIVEKIVTGKIDKFYSDVCLLKQPFVKNPDITVEELLKSKIHELGENIVIRRFTRYQVGEEI